MVCHDDHLLSEGTGFDDHPHSGLVIVSLVLSGAVRHTDSLGALGSGSESSTLAPGDVGVLRAGVGMAHSEFAAAPQTRFIQVWLSDPADDVEPSYDVIPAPVGASGFTRVLEPLPGATFWVARLQDGESITTPPGAKVHLFVARGALLRSSLAEPLHEGDAFLFTDEPPYEVSGGGETDLLCWTFDGGA